MTATRSTPSAIAGADIINSTTPLEGTLLGIHPRLYAREEDFARIRPLLAEPLYATAWRESRESADMFARMDDVTFMGAGDMRSHYAAIPNIVFVWKMTGERRYLDAAVRFVDAAMAKAMQDFGNTLVGGHFGHGMGVALDWLWHDLDPECRTRWCDDLATLVRTDFIEKWASGVAGVAHWYTCNHFSVGLSGLVASAGALYGERPDMAPILNTALEKTRLATMALGESGLSPEGIGYGQYYVTYMVKVMQLLSDLVGIDRFAESPWWKRHASALMHHTLPRGQWTKGSTFMQWGDCHTSHWYGPDVALRACAKAFRDPQARWLADACDAAGVNLSAYEKCFPMLLMDDALPSDHPERLPMMHHFTDFGLMMARSDWDGEETVCGFLCGPSYGAHAMRLFRQPVGGGHMHAFAGHFQAFSHGEHVLPSAGYTAKVARYHNVLTVNGIGHLGESDSGWFEDLAFRQGHATPRMLFVRDTGTAVHAAGDATGGYLPACGVRRHVRHFLYLRPACWVVIDWVETDAPAALAIHFHTGFPMADAGSGAWIGRGEKAGLRVRSLAGEGAFRYEEQETLDHAFKPMRRQPCLVFEVSGRVASAILVTVLDAGAADSIPETEVACEIHGGTVTVCVGGERFRMTADA